MFQFPAQLPDFLIEIQEFLFLIEIKFFRIPFPDPDQEVRKPLMRTIKATRITACFQKFIIVRITFKSVTQMQIGAYTLKLHSF